MKTTVEFLNEVKKNHHLTSDGQLAKLLGLTRSSTCLFMQGKNFLGDETAMKVAELIKADPAFVVACIHAERAKQTPERKMWERIAAMMQTKEVAGLAAALAVMAFLPAANFDDQGFNLAFIGMTAAPAFGSFFADSVYYVKFYCLS